MLSLTLAFSRSNRRETGFSKISHCFRASVHSTLRLPPDIQTPTNSPHSLSPPHIGLSRFHSLRGLWGNGIWRALESQTTIFEEDTLLFKLSALAPRSPRVSSEWICYLEATMEV